MDPSTQKGHMAQYISDFTNDLCARYRNKLTKLGGITGLTCRATMRSPCTMCEDFVSSTVPDQGQGNICPVVLIPTKLTVLFHYPPFNTAYNKLFQICHPTPILPESKM